MAMPGKKKKRSGRTVDDIFPKLHGAKLLYVQIIENDFDHVIDTDSAIKRRQNF